MKFSPAEYAALVAKGMRAVHDSGLNNGGKPEKPEKEIQQEIARYCADRGWVCIRSRMDRRATNACGTPDFIVALSDGRTVYAEAKRKGGKPSPEQNATLAWLRKNKQVCGVVTSLEEFIELCN